MIEAGASPGCRELPHNGFELLPIISRTHDDDALVIDPDEVNFGQGVANGVYESRRMIASRIQSDRMKLYALPTTP